MKTRDLVMIAMMTTLLAVLGTLPGIPLGFIPVPIVLQNLGIMMLGPLLGAKKGTLSVLLLLLLGLVVPVFSGFTTTIKVLAGPTAGYVWAWVFVPVLMVGLQKLTKPKHFWGNFLVIWLIGVLFVDVVGGLYLACTMKLPLYQAVIMSNLAFIPGDTLKALLATILASRLATKSAKNF